MSKSTTEELSAPYDYLRDLLVDMPRIGPRSPGAEGSVAA